MVRPVLEKIFSSLPPEEVLLYSSHPNPVARSTAITFLAETAQIQYLSKIRNLTNDPVEDVRQAAKSATKKLTLLAENASSQKNQTH